MSGFFEYPGAGGGHALEADAEACFWVTRPATDWRTLLASTQTLRFAAGAVALRSGVANSAVSIVVFGRCSDGTQTWTDGQVFGIGSFFSGRAVEHAVTATTDCEIVRLSHDALEVLAAREPELARAIVFELARLLAVTGSR